MGINQFSWCCERTVFILQLTIVNKNGWYMKENHRLNSFNKKLAKILKIGLNHKRADMNFIVVQVDQDYDYVEGVRYIASFPTEDAADAFIQEKNEEQNAKWRARLDYIEQWVDAIEVPETDYHGWVEYLKQYHPFGAMYVFPKDFKKELKGFLRTHHSATIEGYNPPPADHRWNGLHVVEING